MSMMETDVRGLDAVASLSERERTVLRMVHGGYQTDEIARALGRSPNTIENQVASARRKLGGVTRRQAARMLDAADDAGLTDDAPRRVGPSDPVHSASGSPTNKPFAIPETIRNGDDTIRRPAMVQEERAIFLPEPLVARPVREQPASLDGRISTVAMIVATTIGIIVIFAATPMLVESFRAFTAWIIRTFY
ncbi:helix-turn-helix transcriptional regulator [Sphingomonas sp. NBWT7]|uniref:helix-turn-helix domain-containing protein n=1 Tax=Sphingomonas sp. NBWT7 TaxID=2596913 RepID=UPI00162AD795|nr:helix-turn-helix transcriptional regulator [Sphingomonas sp. NBWT7]QNE32178.1 helix-turn-helix transcriptional regulator [Sphingomonas sp. NBWT7]